MKKETTIDPSQDVRSEIAEKSGTLDPLNKIWFHKTATAVIDAGRCVRCGSCVAACPSYSIDIAEDGFPTLVRMCTGCSCCWDFCPLAGMRPERLWKLHEDGNPQVDGLGQVRATYQARALDPAPGAQDGGVVTAILEELLRADEIDGVILTRRHGPLKGQAFVARTVAEFRESAGSVYDQTLPLALLDPHEVGDCRSLAVVGTPCQITGLRALQRYAWKGRKNIAKSVKIAIALFCTRSFDYQRLLIKLLYRGVDMDKVKKVSVSESTLHAYGEDDQVLFEGPVKEFWDAALRGCDECADFSGRLGDIAVGSVGSPSGYTTVLVRTPAGEQAWQLASHALAYNEAYDLEAVARMQRRNARRAAKNLKRQFDPEAHLWISYEEHLQSYAGTDRAPVKSPPHRSHHYKVSC